MRRAPLAGWWLTVMLAVSAVATAAPDLPLVDAAKGGEAARVRQLIQRHADVNGADPDGTTALHWAIYQGAADVAAMLIQAGANVNAANTFAITPLKLAALNGDAALANLLVKAGADPKAVNGEGE